jgi:hypothetical protein
VVEETDTEEGKISVKGTPEEQALRTQLLREGPTMREQGARVLPGRTLSDNTEALDVSSWEKRKGETLSPTDFYRYLQERGAAKGLEEPVAKMLINGEWTNRGGDVAGLDAGQLRGGLDVQGHIESGRAYALYGPEWVDWYEKVAEPMTLTRGGESQDLEQYLPSLPARGERPAGVRSTQELIEDGSKDAYALLAERGAIDTKAKGPVPQDEQGNYTFREKGLFPSTWHVLKAARLMEQQERYSEEDISSFKKQSGVTPSEEAVFRALQIQEYKKVASREGEQPGVGAAAKVAEKEALIAQLETQLAGASSRDLEEISKELASERRHLEVLRRERDRGTSTTWSKPVGVLPGADSAALEELAGDRVDNQSRHAAAQLVMQRSIENIRRSEGKVSDINGLISEAHAVLTESGRGEGEVVPNGKGGYTVTRPGLSTPLTVVLSPSATKYKHESLQKKIDEATTLEEKERLQELADKQLLKGAYVFADDFEDVERRLQERERVRRQEERRRKAAKKEMELLRENLRALGGSRGAP